MYKSEVKYYQKAFFIAMIIGVVLFLPFVIMNGGYFIYYGDYNAQQIPFYYHCNEVIKSGSFMWDWYTDMGANFIGSYSFYTLGSPFFWLTVPFPAEFSRYLMAPLMVLKISCCSLFAFAYIRRFVAKPDSALIGGLLYAFSSFSMYNVFFNHFHEAMVCFPLLLIALEEAVVNKRRIFFGLMVALNAFVNYFFFAGEGVFLILYFLCRITDKKFHVDLKTFLCLAFETIVGMMLSGVILIPALLACFEVPRSGELLMGWDMVFHNPTQRYGLILQSMFFPCELASMMNFFPDCDAQWSSVAAYLPLFSMAGVISFIRYKAKHWAKFLLPICLLFAMIPLLNSVFVMFNGNYYTRWFYMPLLISAFVTAHVLEHKEIDMMYGIKWCALAVGMISMVGILPSKNQDSVIEYFNLPANKLPFWLSVLFAVAALVALYFVVKSRKRLNLTKFLNNAFCFTVIACIGFSYYTLFYGSTFSPEYEIYNRDISTSPDLSLYDDSGEFYRTETDIIDQNANLVWNEYGFKSFHSILPGSTFSYYRDMGYDRKTLTNPSGSYYALRGLNSVKYIVIHSFNEMFISANKLIGEYNCFEKVGSQNGFTIYKNKYFVPMGYSYDYYLPYDKYLAFDEENRDNALIRATALNSEQVTKYSDIIKELPDDSLGDYTFSRYAEDCKALAATCVDSFTPVNNGFVATSSFDKDRFVVFSVPYESGWTATVNGKPVDVENVNGGVMGIRVPAGKCDIEFSYFTPGLKIGIICTIIAAVIFIIYFIVLKVVLKHKANPNYHLYYEEQLGTIKNHDKYIRLITGNSETEKQEVSKDKTENKSKTESEEN